ncbi:MAG: hypothetical protein MUF48_25310 [Pirellulaceae bacterium]|nr:hypothetical protein [Pirellulaceae bacterium]
MVTITILGILLAWAVPSFKDASLSSRLTAFANDLVASAQIARSEAIKRPSDFRIAQGTFGALIFPPDVVGATAATFTVCRATPIGKQKRTVRITASGGTSVARVDSATTCP